MCTKVPLCDLTISDDAERRQIELVVVALTYCATKLWPGRPERVRQAHEEAAQLRAVLAHMQGCTEDTASVDKTCGQVAEETTTATTTSSCTGTTTTTTTSPSASAGRCKDGHNGLSVVSADVIVCKKAMKPSRSRHDGHAASSHASHASAHQAHYAAHNGEAAEVHSAQQTQQEVEEEASTLVTVDSTAAEPPHEDHNNTTTATTVMMGVEHDMQLPIPINTATAATPPLCVETEDGADYGTTATTTTITTAAASAATRSPSRRQVMAATTPQGLLVLVNECGSPLTSEELADAFACHVRLPLSVVRLSGGITNELFHVFDAADASTSVVIRVFGKETERVISRESELFYQSLFLRTYLHGANFLVYEFLHAYAVLPYTDMPREGRAIAAVLAGFQVRATLAAQADHAAPLLPLTEVHDETNRHTNSGSSRATAQEEREGSTMRVCNGHREKAHEAARGSRYAKESNYTLHSLTRWVAQIGAEDIRAKVLPAKQADFASLVQALTTECAWMREVLRRHRASLAEGVCHNDLLSANIMRHCQTGALKIIDFDYTKRNFVLYDIANHFNEYTGLECDYGRYFPTDEQMAEFIAAYRQAMRDCLRQARQGQQHHHHHQQQQQCTCSPSSHMCHDEAAGCSTHEAAVVVLVQAQNGLNGVEVTSSSSNNACSSSNGVRDARHRRHRSDDDADDDEGTAVKDIITDAAELFWSDSEAEEQARVREWTRLVKLLTLASHLSWSVWSLLQEAVSALDVDFLDYAKLRFARYVATKESFACDM